jgi:hypothetical protein
MARMRSTVTITRPLEEVFGFFLALDENVPRTDPTVESVVKDPAGPTGAGTTFRFRQHSLGKQRETMTRFTKVDPDQAIEFEARIGPMRPKCSLTFGRTGTGTSVTFAGDARPIGPLKLFSPLLNRKGQQVWDKRLARIKTVLEEPATQR